MPNCRFDGEREALKAAIARAFDHVEYPGDCGIRAPDVLDDLDVKDFYDGPWQSDWRTVPAETIERNYCSLSSFSADAYRFFLPAYLCYALDAFHDRTSLVLPWLLYDLDPQFGSPDLRHRFHVQKQFLAENERRVVREFLDFVVRHSDDREMRADAQRVLKDYWGAA